MKNIAAFTGPTADSYPSYVSVNEDDDGIIWITTRTAGEQSGSRMAVPMQVLRQLGLEMYSYAEASLRVKTAVEFSRRAAPPAPGPEGSAA